MQFTIFQSEKTPFKAVKTRSSKRRKIAMFPRGLTHGFGPKMVIFPTFFLAKQAWKMSFTIFQKGKTPFQAIKIRNSKSREIGFFSKAVNPWFWSQSGHFSNFFFLDKIGQENVFYVILERKNAFLGFKNKKFKKSKNCHFSKGHFYQWFWSKIGHFSHFFFLVKQTKKMFFTIF